MEGSWEQTEVGRTYSNETLTHGVWETEGSCRRFTLRLRWRQESGKSWSE